MFCLVLTKCRTGHEFIIKIGCLFSAMRGGFACSRFSCSAIRNTRQSRLDPRSRRATRHSRSLRSLGVSQMWRLHFGSLHLRAVRARRLSALHRTLMELQIKQLSVKKKRKKKRALPGRLFSTPLFQSRNTKLLLQACNGTQASSLWKRGPVRPVYDARRTLGLFVPWDKYSDTSISDRCAGMQKSLRFMSHV